MKKKLSDKSGPKHTFCLKDEDRLRTLASVVSFPAVATRGLAHFSSLTAID